MTLILKRTLDLDCRWRLGNGPSRIYTLLPVIKLAGFRNKRRFPTPADEETAKHSSRLKESASQSNAVFCYCNGAPRTGALERPFFFYISLDRVVVCPVAMFSSCAGPRVALVMMLFTRGRLRDAPGSTIFGVFYRMAR